MGFLSRLARKWWRRSNERSVALPYAWISGRDPDAAAELLKTLLPVHQTKPRVVAPPRRRILVVAPHCDDEAMGPGGTLVAARAAGAEISILVLTRGAGASGPVREAESRAVAARLGAEIVFLGLEDGALGLDAAAIDAFATAVEAARPDVLMLPFFLDDHEDHRRASALLALSANRLRVRPEVWAYQVYGGVVGDVIVDITAVAEAKRDLIRLYASQAATRDWVNFSLGLAAWNSRFLPRSDTAFGEVFFVRPFAEWLALATGTPPLPASDPERSP